MGKQGDRCIASSTFRIASSPTAERLQRISTIIYQGLKSMQRGRKRCNIPQFSNVYLYCSTKRCTSGMVADLQRVIVWFKHQAFPKLLLILQSKKMVKFLSAPHSRCAQLCLW